MDLMNELYGDIDVRSSDHQNEDSVDIYSGLENSPKVEGNKVNPIVSPRMMESLDIYEEIIREEQEQKEATYNELKQKLDVAQKQVSELMTKVQLLETKNSSLSSENILLKKNICSLIKTARMEIVRKDEEIGRLSNRSVRGSYGQNIPHSLFESRVAKTRNRLSTLSCSVVESQGVGKDSVLKGDRHNKDRHVQAISSTSAAQPFEVLERCSRTESVKKSDSKFEVEAHNNQLEPKHGPGLCNKTSRSITNSKKDPDNLNTSKSNNPGKGAPGITNDGQTCILKEKHQEQSRSQEKTRVENHEEMSQKKHTNMDVVSSKSLRIEKEPAKTSFIYNESRSLQPEIKISRNTEHSKCPLSQIHKSASSVSSHLSKSTVKTAADVDTDNQRHVQKQNKDKTSRERYSSSTSRPDVEEGIHSKSHKRVTGNERGPEMKEKCSSAEKRSSRTERSKEHEQKKSKDADRSKRDESDCYSIRETKNRPESTREAERRSRKESANREINKRSKKQVDDIDSRRDQFPYPRSDLQHKGIGKEKSSSRIAEGSSKSKKSHSHDKSKKSDSKYLDKNWDGKNFEKKSIERDRERKQTEHLEERRVPKHDKSKDSIKYHKRKFNEKYKTGKNDQDTKNPLEQTLERVCVESQSEVVLNIYQCTTPTENIPNMKLSFMETLNLTLSPLKTQPHTSEHKETFEEASSQSSRGPDEEEEFYILDELRNSVNEVNANLDSSHAELSSSFKPSRQVSNLYTTEKPSSDDGETDVLSVIAESQECVGKIKSFVKATDVQNSMSLETTDLDEGSSSKITVAKESLTDISFVMDTQTAPIKTSEALITDHIPFIKEDNQPNIFSTTLKETSQVDVQGKTESKSPDLRGPKEALQEDASSYKAQNMLSESPANMEVSSSTVSEDLDDGYKTICSVEIGVLDQKSEETIDNSKVTQNSQTSENTLRSMAQINSPVTAKIMSCPLLAFSEPDSTEKEEQVPNTNIQGGFCHDEDSMMLTLRNLKVVPEPISPLSSPIRLVKSAQPQVSDKQPHVRSLNKGLSNKTADKDEVNMEMNKENKSPDSSVTGTNVDVLTAVLEEDCLEDGEIVSESEEEGPLFIQTPPRREEKSASRTVKNPKYALVAKGGSLKKSLPKKNSTNTNVSPASNKRRFKTVSPRSTVAVRTLDCFMDMLGSIRMELRKKYMKLHKTVTKSAFCSIVDMSHASFVEFICAVNLDDFGCKSSCIKDKLHEIVSSILSKATKNGIVNRIFEQKAGDLKQKLWTFVDGQFDFMFKEVKMALKSVSESSKNVSPKKITFKGKDVESETLETENFTRPEQHHIPKKSKVEMGSFPSLQNLPRRGLGSRGKNIRAIMDEEDQAPVTSHQIPAFPTDRFIQDDPSGSDNRSSPYVRHLSHTGSIHDKTDFELLTEQQTSSLTFNLVSDSQMGDIFKCLLQGSDLLETSVPIGENTNWSLCTPQKEGFPGESLFGIITPNKTTPLKCITSWSSFSPYKFASNSKMLVNPAILDESCLLEVPTNSEPCQLSHQSTVSSRRSFSVLEEDLAVSLTIPSPLKSDSHLSFLHPGTGQPLSAPNSVISAHFSEDALLDGEDATEQDIHLSLDTDNSSSGSSPIRTWEGPSPSGFQLQPNLPMQAVVMERSNDHFIVRIRRTSSSPNRGKQPEEKSATGSVKSPNSKIDLTEKVFSSTHENTMSNSSSKVDQIHHISEAVVDTQKLNHKSSPESDCDNMPGNNHKLVSKETWDLVNTELKESSVSGDKVSENVHADMRTPKHEPQRVSRKRKEKQTGPKAKRLKVDKSQEKKCKSKHKKKFSSSKGKGLKPAASPVSPSSLSAKNVIRKKGEVVATWTREEDRDILVELKTKGATPKTFAALSKKLKKSTEQIEERFSQLMKLFKKKEKMEN